MSSDLNFEHAQAVKEYIEKFQSSWGFDLKRPKAAPSRNPYVEGAVHEHVIRVENRVPLHNSDSHTLLVCVLLNELQKPFARLPLDRRLRCFDTAYKKCHSSWRRSAEDLSAKYEFWPADFCNEVVICITTTCVSTIPGRKEYWLEASAECVGPGGEIVPVRLGLHHHHLNKVQIVLCWDSKQERGPLSSYYPNFKDMPWKEIMRLIWWRAACQYDDYGLQRNRSTIQSLIENRYGQLFP